MIPYLLMFTFSISLIWVGLSLQQKWPKRLLVFIGLLLPCVMAAMRDISIGSDTRGYIHKLYLFASKSSNIKEFFNTAFIMYAQKDYLYLIITYIMGHFGLGFNMLLFIYEILIVFPIYFTFKKLKFTKYEIIIGLLSFYLIFYNVTFNMLRQSIAISFIVLAFAFYLKNSSKFDKILAYLFILISIEFHSTALFIIPFFWMYRLYMTEKIKTKYKIGFSVILNVMSLIFVVFYESILTFIGKSGIYKLALLYLERYSYKNFSFYQAFINLLIIIIIVISKKKFNKNSYIFLISLSIINMLISSGLGYFIQYSQRIMLYIQYILLFCFIPKIAMKFDKKNIVIFICGMVLFSTWILYFVIKNVHETVPYVFGF